MKTAFVDRTPSLFDMPSVGSVNLPAQAPSVRREAIEGAFAKADAAFIERYTMYLISHGSVVRDFIAGEVTAAFEKRYVEISPSQKKALGGLFQRMMRSKLIEKTGEYRARDQGNASAVYRLRRKG